jgi:hypothetical protein
MSSPERNTNALRHGFFARDFATTSDQPAELDAQLQRLTEELKPEDEIERDLLKRYALASFRHSRLLTLEARLLERVIGSLGHGVTDPAAHAQPAPASGSGPDDPTTQRPNDPADISPASLTRLLGSAQREMTVTLKQFHAHRWLKLSQKREQETREQKRRLVQREIELTARKFYIDAVWPWGDCAVPPSVLTLPEGIGSLPRLNAGDLLSGAIVEGNDYMAAILAEMHAFLSEALKRRPGQLPHEVKPGELMEAWWAYQRGELSSACRPDGPLPRLYESESRTAGKENKRLNEWEVAERRAERNAQNAARLVEERAGTSSPTSHAFSP